MTAGCLQIPTALYEEMVEHARKTAPLECCGLLGGTGQRAEHHYPVRNELESPTEYLGNPRDLLDAFRDLRKRGLDLVAIYHSHPSTPPLPSRTDLQRNLYVDTPHLILSLAGREPEMRAFRLGPDDFQELPWELV